MFNIDLDNNGRTKTANLPWGRFASGFSDKQRSHLLTPQGEGEAVGNFLKLGDERVRFSPRVILPHRDEIDRLPIDKAGNTAEVL